MIQAHALAVAEGAAAWEDLPQQHRDAMQAAWQDASGDGDPARFEFFCHLVSVPQHGQMRDVAAAWDAPAAAPGGRAAGLAGCVDADNAGNAELLRCLPLAAFRGKRLEESSCPLCARGDRAHHFMQRTAVSL